MKKISLLVFLLILCSCGNSDSNELVLKRYANVIAEKPKIEGDNVRVWNIKKTNLIRINLVEMSGELSKHRHPDAEHSLVVLDGEVKVLVADSTLVLKKNDFISIPKNVVHKYWTISPKAYLLSMDAPYYDPEKTVRLE